MNFLTFYENSNYSEMLSSYVVVVQWLSPVHFCDPMVFNDNTESLWIYKFSRILCKTR